VVDVYRIALALSVTGYSLQATAWIFAAAPAVPGDLKITDRGKTLGERSRRGRSR
jgi:hypothetical protein